MGSAKRWCLSCQFFLTPEFLTSLPKLKPKLQAHPTPHTSHPIFVRPAPIPSSVIWLVAHCSLIIPPLPLSKFYWPNRPLQHVNLGPRASFLLGSSYPHSLMQIHLCCFSFQILIIINLPGDIPSDSESPPYSININNSSIKWIYVLTVSWTWVRSIIQMLIFILC